MRGSGRRRSPAFLFLVPSPPSLLLLPSLLFLPSLPALLPSPPALVPLVYGVGDPGTGDGTGHQPDPGTGQKLLVSHGVRGRLEEILSEARGLFGRFPPFR